MFAIFGICMGISIGRLIAHKEYAAAVFTIIAFAVGLYISHGGD